jgi:hypothetical protein
MKPGLGRVLLGSQIEDVHRQRLQVGLTDSPKQVRPERLYRGDPHAPDPLSRWICGAQKNTVNPFAPDAAEIRVIEFDLFDGSGKSCVVSHTHAVFELQHSGLLTHAAGRHECQGDLSGRPIQRKLIGDFYPVERAVQPDYALPAFKTSVARIRRRCPCAVRPLDRPDGSSPPTPRTGGPATA